MQNIQDVVNKKNSIKDEVASTTEKNKFNVDIGVDYGAVEEDEEREEYTLNDDSCNFVILT